MQKRDKDVKELLSDINKYKLELINETGLIIYYSLSAYLYCISKFGVSSEVTKDCLRVVKEFTDINYYEKRILKFIKKHIKTMDTGVALELIDTMSDRKEEEIVYYYQVLDDIETACDMQQEFRAKRIKKPHTSIYDDQEFLANLYASKYTVDDICNYLNWSQEEKDFITSRINNPLYGVVPEEVFSVNYKVDENNIVTDIELTLPAILDYKSLMINVNLLIQSGYLYASYINKIPLVLEQEDDSLQLKKNSFDEEFKQKMLTY